MPFDATTQVAFPSREVTALHFLRHPHVETGGERLAYGHSDLPLSASGEADGARLLAFARDRLPPPAGVISSDLRRCTAIAAPLADSLGVPLRTTAALREQHMGEWEGVSWAQLTREQEQRVRDYWTDYLHTRPPGGESMADLGARIERWWADAFDALRGQRWIVVTHVGVIRVFVCRALGLPYADALRFAPARSSHTLVLHAEAGAVLEVFGERPVAPDGVVAPAWEPAR